MANVVGDPGRLGELAVADRLCGRVPAALNGIVFQHDFASDVV